MVPYIEQEVGIGYIGGKTITVGSWDFSQRVFSVHLAGNQSNWHKLALEGKVQGVNGLIRTTRKQTQGLGSMIGLVLYYFRPPEIIRR